MKEIKNNALKIIKENKKKSILIIALLILTIIAMLFNKLDFFNKNLNKIYKTSNYVFTDEKKKINNNTSYLPYINLLGDDANKINEEISTLYYKTNALNKQYMTYMYYVNDDILTLILKLYENTDSDFESEIYFYNFSISNKTLLSDETLKEIFDISDNIIEEKINSKLKEYYEYELKKEYVSPSVCDFNCYKDFFNDDNFQNIKFYVKNNSLYAYKKYNIDYMIAYDSEKPFEDLYSFKLN